MDKYQNQYRIPSARALWHNYNGGCYFVTICTAGKLHYFGKIENAEMQLNELGCFVAENLQQITTHYPYAEIPLFVVMPNHIHLIIWINDKMNDNMGICRDVARNVSTIDDKQPNNKIMSDISPKRGCLSTVIRGFKSAITKFANQHNIPFSWQARFYDRIIRDRNELNNIAQYIENNPAHWDSDELSTINY